MCVQTKGFAKQRSQIIMSNFQPLEVVDRVSETQLQVVENFKTITQQDKG